MVLLAVAGTPQQGAQNSSSIIIYQFARFGKCFCTFCACFWRFCCKIIGGKGVFPTVACGCNLGRFFLEQIAVGKQTCTFFAFCLCSTLAKHATAPFAWLKKHLLANDKPHLFCNDHCKGNFAPIFGTARKNVQNSPLLPAGAIWTVCATQKLCTFCKIAY